jgi:hypothetical protein
VQTICTLLHPACGLLPGYTIEPCFRRLPTVNQEDNLVGGNIKFAYYGKQENNYLLFNNPLFKSSEGNPKIRHFLGYI